MELWSGVFGFAVGLVLVGVFILSAMKVSRCLKGGFRDDDFVQVMVFSVVGALCMMVGPMMGHANGKQAIKAITAPRLVIVEHLRGLKP